MRELSADEFPILEGIFPVAPGLQTASYLIEQGWGRWFVDSRTNPKLGLIWYEKQLIISGEKGTAGLKKLIGGMNFHGLLEVRGEIRNQVEDWFPQADPWDYVYYTVEEKSAVNVPEGAVIRNLRVKDAEFLHNLGEPWLWKFYRSPREMVENMPSAGIFFDDRPVSICCVFTRSAKYDDLGVATHPEYRGRGWGTAVTARLSNGLLVKGRMPVWNTAAVNIGARRIAEKCGFKELKLNLRLFKINGEI